MNMLLLEVDSNGIMNTSEAYTTPRVASKPIDRGKETWRLPYPVGHHLLFSDAIF